MRCQDCFGSGVAGDGAIDTYSTPEVLLAVACPICSVPPLERCRTGFPEADYEPTVLTDGDVERHVHRARSRAAVAAHLARNAVQRVA